MSLIFLVRILRIQNGHIAIPQKLDHLRPFRLGKCPCSLIVDSILALPGELQFERLVRFVVWQVGERSGAGKKTIARADAWMIHKLCLHLHFADVKLHLL